MNILIADDHIIVRRGLKAVLSSSDIDVENIFEAENGNDVLEIFENHKNKIDLFILDLSMPVLNGVDVARKIIEKDADSKIIVFSTHSQENLVERAVEAGVKGYILKDDPPDLIIKAIKEVMNDNIYFSQKIIEYVMKNFMRKGEKKVSRVELTSRESEILQLVVEGHSSKDIAYRLDVAISTVNIHRKNIMDKMGVNNTAQLIVKAIKEGIILL